MEDETPAHARASLMEMFACTCACACEPRGDVCVHLRMRVQALGRCSPALAHVCARLRVLFAYSCMCVQASGRCLRAPLHMRASLRAMFACTCMYLRGSGRCLHAPACAYKPLGDVRVHLRMRVRISGRCSQGLHALARPKAFFTSTCVYVRSTERFPRAPACACKA